MKFSPNQNGQTLIETLVAAFILTMGISAALGLANYSLGATSSIRQQTIAIGLAREGLEVVKNMRDTNWLRGTRSTNCYDFLSGGSTAYCYRDWLSAAYDLDPTLAGGNYTIVFDQNRELPWELVPVNPIAMDDGPSVYSLSLDTDPTNHGTFYYSGGGGDDSKFNRAITITEENFEPFNQDTGPRLKVTSQVWWTDRNCPAAATPVTSNPCLVTLETYLTNWRNF